MNEKINFLGDLQRLELKPGDCFVLTTEQHLSVETVERIQETWEKFVGGEEPKLLILQGGMKLGAISFENFRRSEPYEVSWEYKGPVGPADEVDVT